MVIAIVTYENPTIVEAVLRIGAKAVLPSPVRSFGLLSSLVVARRSMTTSSRTRAGCASWRASCWARAASPRPRAS